MMHSKRCPACWEMRLASEFYPGDRGTTLCKSCMSSREKARRSGNIVSILDARVKRDLDWVAEYKADWQKYIYAHDGEWPEGEVWRPCFGYEGFYEVSDLGRVRSLFTNRHSRPIRRTVPKIIKQYTNRLGYKTVSFVTHGIDGKSRKSTQNVHTLVIVAFCGERPNGFVCGHRDGNPSNNNISNLQWITYVENERDKRAHGRALDGSRNHQSKLDESAVVEMRRLYESRKETAPNLSKQYGISRATTYKILKRSAWRHV